MSKLLQITPTDKVVNKIMERTIPAFADADLQQALSAVVHLFAMAICRCPPSERENIVRTSVDPILTIAATMAALPK
jgi:hypothetical protein